MTRNEAGKIGYEKVKHLLKANSDRVTAEKAAAYYLLNKKCGFCSTALPYEKRKLKFCDHSCAAKKNNLGVRRHKIRRCTGCDTILNRGAKQHCKACWKRVRGVNPRSLEEARSPQSRRKVLLRTRGSICQVCLLSTWNGKPIAIEVDHINGNSDDNSSENLRLVCPNCHAQTDTYKGRNRFKGSQRQLKRRERYRAGLTY
jgi:hypothetical protein